MMWTYFAGVKYCLEELFKVSANEPPLGRDAMECHFTHIHDVCKDCDADIGESTVQLMRAFLERLPQAFHRSLGENKQAKLAEYQLQQTKN